MIHISTDYSEKNREKYLIFQDDYFRAVTLNEPLDDIDVEIIKKVDGVKDIIDDRIVYGRYGIIPISEISGGAKTIINLRNMLKKNDEAYIEITSCGDNAIDVLVNVLKQYEKHKNIYLLTCLANYISYEPIKLRVNNAYDVTCFAKVRG